MHFAIESVARACARLVLVACAATTIGACGGAAAPASTTATAPRAAQAAPPANDATTGDALPVGSDDASWGSADAPVVMVEFSDFECPYCARAQPAISALKEAYGPSKLRIVWKNQPLSGHAHAMGAAEAAEGVRALGGNDAFWRFHDRAFAAQGDLGRAAYTAWAKDAGVDAGRFDDGMRAHAWRAKVERDRAVAQRLGVDGTPTFFVNGAPIIGARPLADFRRAIDAEATKAAQRVSAGATPRDVARLMTAENLAHPPPGDDDGDGEPAPDERRRVAIGTSPARGPKDARVTIVEFGDFECPFTKKAEGPLAALLAAHPGDVRVVWKNEPLTSHPRAEPAAELAQDARAQKGDGAFWAAHDKLLDVAPRLEDADLDAVAKGLGLDAARAKKAIATKKYRPSIDADELAADDLDVHGTPIFFVNGKRLAGAQTAERLEQVFAEERARADVVLASGVAKDAVYDALIKDARGAPEPEKVSVTFPEGAAPARGNAKAKVTIVEFADFQCPFCEKVEGTLKEVLATYGDRVRLEWRNLPLPMHENAELAAEAASEAFRQKGPIGFWKMHDVLFANTATEHGLERAALDGYARANGLDMKAWGAALDAHTHRAAVTRDAEAAQRVGIHGTPAFLVNGYVLSGAQPARRFKRLVDRALAEAK